MLGDHRDTDTATYLIVIIGCHKFSWN